MRIGKWLAITSAVFVGVTAAGFAVRYADLSILSAALSHASERMRSTTHQIRQATYQPKPVTKQYWIPGKPLEECMKEHSVIDNTVVRCNRGYWSNTRTYFQ